MANTHEEPNNCLKMLNITSDINELKISDSNELCNRERRDSNGSHSSYEDLMTQTPNIMEDIIKERIEQKAASKERYLKRKAEEKRRKKPSKREYPQGSHSRIFQGKGTARLNSQKKKTSPSSEQDSESVQDNSFTANEILTETTELPQFVTDSTKTECPTSDSNTKCPDSIESVSSKVQDSTQKDLEVTEKPQSTKLKKQSQLMKDFEKQLKSSQTFSSRARMLSKHKK